MAKLVYGSNLSLDGYVDHDKFGPDSELFLHWIEVVRGAVGSVYGRRVYELMTYWDEEHPEWDGPRRAFAEAWRAQHKWVASRTLKSVGPNASLIEGDVPAAVGKLKAEIDGTIGISGTRLAHSVADLIDEYRLYYHPVVLGGGKPFFAGPQPPLRFVESPEIGNAVRLTYVPA